MPNAHAPMEGIEHLITVGITPKRTIFVSHDSLVLSKGRGDTVSWVFAENPGEFKIVFATESPFHEKAYNQVTARRLRPRPDISTGVYKYILSVPGCPALDPDIVITP